MVDTSRHDLGESPLWDYSDEFEYAVCHFVVIREVCEDTGPQELPLGGLVLRDSGIALLKYTKITFAI